MKCPKKRSAWKEKSNCGNQVAEIVGEQRGERKKELWQPSCRKLEKKKRIVATKLQKLGPKIGGKKKRNCGSQVAEIEKEKKKRKIDLWMELSKMGGGEKKNCGNGVAKNWRGERERERERERIVRLKKIFCSIDSYSKKKYTYSYSFHMPVVFFTETVWFVPICHVLSFHPVKVITIDSLHDLLYETNNYRFKYIDSYSCQRQKSFPFNKWDLCWLEA